MIQRVVVSVVSAALLAGAGMAVGADEIPEFDRLDADGDGYVSSDEARALPCIGERFDELEAQSEEGLSRDEYWRAVAEHCGESD